MKRDPIVDEVRRRRHKIWKECGSDLIKLLDEIQAAERLEDTKRLLTREDVLKRKGRRKRAS